MIDYYKRTVQQKEVKRIPNFQIGCWINVVSPKKEDIDYLVKKFKLDKKNLKSGLDPNEIPRLDSVKGVEYIFTNLITDIKRHQVETYLIVVGKNFVLTLSKYEPKFIERILTGEVKFITTQKLKCLINLLSLINEDFEQTTIDIIRTVQEKKRLNIGEIEIKEKEINLLLNQEDILNDFVSSYYYMNLLYERIIKRIKFFEQDREILEDLIIEGNQGFNLCKSSLKTISNIRNYYTILLSNKLNKIITILTIFTILISFPAAISGLYGMNVILPLQSNSQVFYYILILVALIWGFFIIYLKKKKIL